MIYFDDDHGDYNYDLFEKIPITRARPSSWSQLSLSLNPEQIIPSDTGVSRDYRGLGEVMGFSHADVKNFQRSPDPTKEVIQAYHARNRGATVKDLLLMIEKIDRFDVIDDLKPMLEKDVSCPLPPVQKSSDADQLTMDDIFSGGVHYDAYVCYSDEDRDFVIQLVDFLESPSINFKLFLRERDLLAGNLEYDSFTQLIGSRCRRMVVILSPSFLESPEFDWQIRFASSLAVEQRTRKVIPVVYRKCSSLPPILGMLAKIDLSNHTDGKEHQQNSWAWRKLVLSIGGTMAGVTNTMPNSHPTLLATPCFVKPSAPELTSDKSLITIDSSPIVKEQEEGVQTSADTIEGGGDDVRGEKSGNRLSSKVTLTTSKPKDNSPSSLLSLKGWRDRFSKKDSNRSPKESSGKTDTRVHLLEREVVQ